MSTSVLFAQRPGEQIFSECFIAATTAAATKCCCRLPSSLFGSDYLQGPKPIEGLFKIHQQEENYLIEIPDSLLGRGHPGCKQDRQSCS
jgi:hypothetical protein